MKTIYKYPLEVEASQTVELPRDAEILSAGLDGNGRLCIWVKTDSDECLFKNVEIHVIGTGQEIPDNAEYFETVLMKPYVWHIFF